MKNIMESLKDLYAVKLFNWQIDGKEDIESCYKTIDFVEKNKKELYCHKVIARPKDKEVENWIVGYCKTFNFKVFRLKSKEGDTTEFLFIKHIVNEDKNNNRNLNNKSWF